MPNRRPQNWNELPGEVRNAQAALRRRLRLTQLAIALERFARAFWPLWTLGFVFAAATMFGTLGLLTAGWVKLVLAAVALIALVLLARGARLFRWPTIGDAENRIDDALPGRPIAAMGDVLATDGNDPAALRVWSVHLRRMAQAALKAKTAIPAPRLERVDVWGLRLIGAVAIVAALVFARGNGATALQSALTTPPDSQALVAGPVYEAWANPPAYTGKPALYLNQLLGEGTVLIPVGTEVTIRIYGEDAVNLVETVSGAASQLSASAQGVRDANLVVTKAGEISVQGPDGKLAKWNFEVIPDAPPTIRLTEPVARALSGATELHFAAKDDYGVVEAWVDIALDMTALQRRYGLAAEPQPIEQLTASLPLSANRKGEEFTENMVEDFSKHVWAGLPVTMTLHARDGAGQEGTAIELVAALPARRFFDPLAAAIVEQRRDLLWSPDNAQRVERVLKSVTWHPQDIFTDNSAYLLARAAIRRLGYAKENGLVAAEIDDLAEMLWVLALKIEDGDLSDAAEALRRAQERLSEALENGATEDELAQLTEELREAMQEYLQQMAREMMENGEPQQQAENQQTITQDQLQAMLDEIQRLAENGQTEEAQELLEQLRRMMENMQMTMQQGQQGQGQQGQGEQTTQQLQDMLRQQQELADDAFREMQEQFRQSQNGQQGQGEGQQGQLPEQGGTPGREGMTPGEMADRQEALRQLLEELRNGLPGASSEEGQAAREALRQAERDMEGARDNLEGEALGDALDRQADALENMRQGLRDLSEEMRQQAQSQGRQPGEGMQSEQSGQGSRDPLGRPTGEDGSIFSNDQLLQGQDAMQRARELLDEIRRRSGEQGRPKLELDYLKRLLERF